MRALIFHEAGISYTREPHIAAEMGWKGWKYITYFKGERQGEASLYCCSLLSALIIVNYWTGQNGWAYRLVH